MRRAVPALIVFISCCLGASARWPNLSHDGEAKIVRHELADQKCLLFAPLTRTRRRTFVPRTSALAVVDGGGVTQASGSSDALAPAHAIEGIAMSPGSTKLLTGWCIARATYADFLDHSL